MSKISNKRRENGSTTVLKESSIGKKSRKPKIAVAGNKKATTTKKAVAKATKVPKAKAVSKKTKSIKPTKAVKNLKAVTKEVAIKIESLEGEKWKLVKTNSETNRCIYKISNFGRAKSIHRIKKSEKLLKPAKAAWNFLQLNVVLKDGKKQGLYYHRMVADAFLKKSAKKNFVVHLDSDKTNNHFSNLEWVDQKTLTKIQADNGLYDAKRYVKHKNVKLTFAKVKNLKKALRSGKLNKTALSKKFGVSLTQIKRIERGENWKHVE